MWPKNSSYHGNVLTALSKNTNVKFGFKSTMDLFFCHWCHEYIYIYIYIYIIYIFSVAIQMGFETSQGH